MGKQVWTDLQPCLQAANLGGLAERHATNKGHWTQPEAPPQSRLAYFHTGGKTFLQAPAIDLHSHAPTTDMHVHAPTTDMHVHAPNTYLHVHAPATGLHVHAPIT
jgi:hypothetical protein